MKPTAILDIGSSKVVCLCGSFVKSDGITVHGVSVCPYAGYQNGVFFDHRALHAAIVESVQQAEQQARFRIREVAVSVPAPFSRIMLSEAAVPTTGKNKRVTAEDIDNVISQSLAKVALPDYTLMHSTPVSFTVNGLVVANTPVGMKTDELGALVSHMYVQDEFVHTVEQSLSTIDVEIAMCVGQQLCNLLTVIPEKERVRPAVLIDVGYTHTDVAVAENAALRSCTTLDVGGKHFSSDLSFGLDVPMETAENVKRRYVFLQKPLSSTQIVRSSRGAKRVNHSAIQLIMESRASELATLIAEAVAQMGVSLAGHPAVYVTGGGMAMIKGAEQFLARCLQAPVSRDTPWVQDMDTPNYTSAFAALDFVLRALDDAEAVDIQPEGRVVDKLRNLFTK